MYLKQGQKVYPKQEKKCIQNGDKRVLETGIKKCPNGGNLVKKTGEIFSDTLSIPTCGRQTGKNLVKIGGGGNFITFLGIKCVWTCLAPAESPQGRVSQAFTGM